MENKKQLVSYGVLVVAIAFMAYGMNRGEVMIVMNKAINICLECIGLG